MRDGQGRAKGARVVRGSGVEYETDISFAGLHQLVASLSHELDRLPPPMREALEVALGLGVGPAPKPIAVMTQHCRCSKRPRRSNRYSSWSTTSMSSTMRAGPQWDSSPED